MKKVIDGRISGIRCSLGLDVTVNNLVAFSGKSKEEIIDLWQTSNPILDDIVLSFLDIELGIDISILEGLDFGLRGYKDH